MFQTPFSDRIRNEGRLATMAVGNIYEPDHANSILAAGRADLVVYSTDARIYSAAIDAAAEALEGIRAAA
jgi:2,4-dienoyl-CoA reductase-like NADH-dependent reductase (Old Yellow Enzyme family)